MRFSTAPLIVGTVIALSQLAFTERVAAQGQDAKPKSSVIEIFHIPKARQYVESMAGKAQGASRDLLQQLLKRSDSEIEQFLLRMPTRGAFETARGAGKIAPALVCLAFEAVETVYTVINAAGGLETFTIIVDVCVLWGQQQGNGGGTSNGGGGGIPYQPYHPLPVAR